MKPSHPRTGLWTAAIAAALLQAPLATQAELFKIDFGHIENERIPTDAEGTPLDPQPLLLDWDVIPTWTFAEPNSNVTDGSASIKGEANAAGTEVTWKLRDSSDKPNTKVTLTIMDNRTLAEKLSPDAPPYMLGGSANNPTKEGRDVVYDGVRVPGVVKDDYLYRNPDTPDTESLMRIANLTPGTYNVTVFEGRTSDAFRAGKIWVDDIKGLKEPATQNTGNYSGKNDAGEAVPDGQPRTVTVKINPGDYLWFAEMEDNSGGISGMIIRSVIDPGASNGLFKIDFGQLENERIPKITTANQSDAGSEGSAPAPLAEWNVIPTWTFSEPNANVTDGSGSIKGTANADATEVTWKLTDFSKSQNKNVTVSIFNNVALDTEKSFPPATGQTANNPTKEGIAVMYDGVLVPAAVKDDYLYRNPDTDGSEILMRFAGLNPGKYNVTVFEGRTSDANRTGKIWVDDIKGLKAPAAQNTGNYSGKGADGTVYPLGQPRTIVVDIKAGEFLWFAEMEDNSGGISGMIIRGLPSAPSAVTLQSASALGGAFTAVAGATVDGTAKTITIPAPSSSAFYRLSGASKISISTSGANLVFKYE
ncbi:MAG: hypothetical protein FJ396_11945 [Verrucomicrobia bacterium]|nr:hypothetical protein [Verrucomicrobiota bacterium]